MKIGIIGIGMLGEAVALNLLNLGFDVSVYNRTKEKVIEVEKNGAIVMNSPISPFITTVESHDTGTSFMKLKAEIL